MQTQQPTALDTSQEQSPLKENLLLEQPRITGFDRGYRTIFKEPSFYLSIAVLFVISSVTFSNMPLLFWTAFLLTSLLSFLLHIFAERSLFSTKKENDYFPAPGEGIFVLTFGALLPGVSLLAYALHTMSTSPQPIFLDSLGKLALLLIVPIFNLAVWSSVRKRYLTHPRVTGLMNGLALGLAASWTLIWLKCFLFAQTAIYCKFGWMFLLFASPLLLFASVALILDLRRKSEARIARIAGTYSLLGALLSSTLVFAPMAHSLFIQSLLSDARRATPDGQPRSFNMLRSFATDADLRPSENPVAGFELAQLLISDRGLNALNETDRDLYFKITGSLYKQQVKNPADANSFYGDAYLAGAVVGPQIPGLSLSTSKISGTIDTTTSTAALDWAMTFHNDNTQYGPQEARAEISLPPGATVSNVMLWVDGHPRSGAFAPTTKARDAYQSTVNRRRDPLLVTMSGLNRVLVQCWPVPVGGTGMKVRLGFTLPLAPGAGNTASMQLPRLLDSNFALPRRQLIHVLSQDPFTADNTTMVTRTKDSRYCLDAIIRNSRSAKPLQAVQVTRTSAPADLAIADPYSDNEQFITQRLEDINAFAPRHVFVVIDSSASLKPDYPAIKDALSTIPQGRSPRIYFCPESTGETSPADEIRPISLSDARETITPDSFIGGQDNGPVLREALETASETPGSAVLWIHGPQPLEKDRSQSLSSDLVNAVHLYDYQVEPGPETLVQSLHLENLGTKVLYTPVPHTATIAGDLKKAFTVWATPSREQLLVRTIEKNRTSSALISDPAASARVASLWANEQVAKALAGGQIERAIDLAERYHLVTPVSAAVVLESESDQKKLVPHISRHRIHKVHVAKNKVATNASQSSTASETESPVMVASADPAPQSPPAPPSVHIQTPVGGEGLVGAPVDPRYGQSCEVGQMADFGYDTARDISRMLTGLSFLISIIAGTFIIDAGRKHNMLRSAITKALALIFALPLTIHIVGTFLINNFGGLGGGL